MGSPVAWATYKWLADVALEHGACCLAVKRAQHLKLIFAKTICCRTFTVDGLAVLAHFVSFREILAFMLPEFASDLFLWDKGVLLSRHLHWEPVVEACRQITAFFFRFGLFKLVPLSSDLTG
jgi:hypothetical protein